MSDPHVYGPAGEALNFLGLEPEHSGPGSRVWVLPVPYEATTTYGKGTARGPGAMIAASQEVELYDREFGCEPAMDFGVRTLAPLEIVTGPPSAMVDRIERAVAGIMSGSPGPEILAILGGEHSITAGALRGLATSFAEATEPARSLGEGGAGARGSDGLVTVQIDAHADLRDEYDGTPHSHACAARRILETCPLFQIGIRNISKEGDAFRRGCDHVRTVFAEEATAPGGGFLDELASFVRGKTVYLTIDLDGLDPSIMPSAGTPEPGGLSWARAVEVARTIAREAASVPVFDVVELAPIEGLVAPDFLAAKLAYKVMSLACAP